LTSAESCAVWFGLMIGVPVRLTVPAGVESPRGIV
jgi:hypothetical protein